MTIVTTLLEEVEMVRKIQTLRVGGFHPYDKFSLEEKILSALITYARDDVKFTTEEKQGLCSTITALVKSGCPIPVTFTMANSISAPSQLKNVHPYPTYAWMHNILAMIIIAGKVKKIYDPGVHFYLFEEGYLLYDMFGIKIEAVNTSLKIFKRIIEEMDLDNTIKIIPIQRHDLPDLSEKEIAETKVLDAEVYAVLCSLSEMTNENVMDRLYTSHSEDYSPIQSMVGNLWQIAEEIARKKNAILALRKKCNLFQEKIKTPYYIDGVITIKPGRVCFRPTKGALFNHGVALLDATANKFSCHVVPAYRIKEGKVLLGEQQRTLEEVRISDLSNHHNPYLWRYMVCA